jgi:hypothetical protein
MPRNVGYGNTGRTPDFNMLLRALMEQEENQSATGQEPSGIATNAYLGSIPLTREQGREAQVIGESDRRYLQSREDERKRMGDLADAQSNASVRGFERRTGVAEEQGPMRTIRRFGSSGEFTDPDAAMGARERAMNDPRVIAAETKADADAAIAGAKGAIKDSGSMQADAESEQTRKEIVRLANQLKDSPYLDANVGPISVWTPTVRGESNQFQSDVDRLRNMLSLEARGKLKGQGAVSDFEGKMLSSSQSALNRGADEASFKRELERIIAEAQRPRAKASSGVPTYNPATGRVDP